MISTLVDDPVSRAYYDAQFHRDAYKVLPGEYFATDRDMVLVTVLGSCVSACIRDRHSGIGGMNHFMLPDAAAGMSQSFPGSARYGIHAMEMLINTLLKSGARRDMLEAKVFGGGNVLSSIVSNQVGQRNAEFVVAFLKNEYIPVVGSDLLDEHPRKVYYFPATGRALVKALYVLNNNTIKIRESAYRQQMQQQPDAGAIELFA